MKKVLVIGAGGTIGKLVIKYLLSEGKYEITALDLKNKRVHKALNPYRKRINIIYGDVADSVLLDSLIKDHNIIINLATVLPPMAEFKKDLVSLIEYGSNEKIIKSINKYNPKCHLIYLSSTSVYSNNEVSISEKLENKEDDYFSDAKINSERIISKKLNNYTILRIALVLSDLRINPFIYNVNLNDTVEVISKEDAAYAIVKCLDNLNKVNKKVLNIGGGKTCQIKFLDLIIKIMKYHGFSCKYLLATLFVAKNYKSPILLDSEESNKLLKYQNDSIESYFLRQKRRSSKRKFSKFIGKIIIFFIKRRHK